MARRFAIFSCLILTIVSGAAAQRTNDPCQDARIQLAGNAPDLTLVEIRKNSGCYDNGFIRVIGIYRVAFENSDLYDPTDANARAWLTFDPFYSAIKRCSASNLSTLTRKDGGTFGVIALGVIKTIGRYGHMNGWKMEFQPICFEKVELLSSSAAVLKAQDDATRKKIIDWHTREVRKLF